MKILVDAREVHRTGAGIGRYIYNLFHDLERVDCPYSFGAVVTREGVASLPPLLADETLEISVNAVTRLLKPVRDNLGIPRFFKRGDFRLFYAAGHFAPAFDDRIPLAATVHDLTPFIFREAFPWYVGAYLRFSMKRIASKAKVIAVPSENTKVDLIRILGVEADRIRVIYPSLALSEPKIAPDTNPVKLEKYILTVGTNEPRKNLSRLIQAYSRLEPDLREEYPLVITGKMGWKGYSYDEMIKGLGIAKNVIFTGFIEERMLPYLFKRSTIFCYPSLYEGFGYPPLEAMFYGAPVLTSNVASLPEVMGDAAVLVNPYSVEAIADGMKKLLHNESLRAELRNEGRVQAQKYNNNGFAEGMMKVFGEGLR